MQLQAYLEREKLTPSRFAQQLKRPASTVIRVLNGERQPGMDLLREIARVTNNEVTPNDFLEETVRHGADPGEAAR